MTTPRDPSKAVAASNRRLVAAGGRRVSGRLHAPAAAALASLEAHWGLSANAAMERALILCAAGIASLGKAG
jgi:hypothetical protein